MSDRDPTQAIMAEVSCCWESCWVGYKPAHPRTNPCLEGRQPRCLAHRARRFCLERHQPRYLVHTERVAAAAVAAAYLLLVYPHVRTLQTYPVGLTTATLVLAPVARCSSLVVWLPQVKQAGKWVSWALSPKSKVNALPTATSPLKAFSPRTLQAVPM